MAKRVPYWHLKRAASQARKGLLAAARPCTLPSPRTFQTQIRTFLEWLGLLGNIALLLAATTYLTYGSQKQRDLEVSQAWSIIADSLGKKGNGGRIKAMELINASPSNSSSWRFPWLSWQYPWLASPWPKESLAGLEAPGAYLLGIQLPHATLANTNLNNALLVGANLKETFLGNAQLQGASLLGANLQGADLSMANLNKASLQKARLSCVEAEKQERCTRLMKTYLNGADLSGADLRGAYVLGAQFRNAYLVGTDLRGIRIVWKDLSPTSFQGAWYTDATFPPKLCALLLLGDRSCPTRFPNGFNPKSEGLRLLTEKNVAANMGELFGVQKKALDFTDR